MYEGSGIVAKLLLPAQETLFKHFSAVISLET